MVKAYNLIEPIEMFRIQLHLPTEGLGLVLEFSEKEKGAVALKGLCNNVNRSLIVENSHPWYASFFSQMRKRNVYFSVEEDKAHMLLTSSYSDI